MVKKPFSRLLGILTGARGPEGEDPLTFESRLTRLEKFGHFCVLVWKSFVRSRCPVRASALSFASLLALIPMLAVAVSVTSSLLKSQGEERIYQFIDKTVASFMPPAVATSGAQEPPTPSTVETNEGSAWQPPASSPRGVATPSILFSTVTTTNATGGTNEVVVVDGENRVTAQKEAAKYINGFIQNINSGKLGIAAMIALVVVAMRMLASVEETFNDIWGVTRGRNWLRRITQYWAVITLGPLLLTLALSLLGSPHFQATEKLLGRMPLFDWIVHQVVPVMVMWVTFALFYQVIPNTKVQFSSAMIGGIVSGTLWHLNNLFGFLYVSRVVTNSKIYGSLGLIPIFMAGVYLSWLIFLFGAQVAYACQNRTAYLQEKLIENVNQRGREFIALRLMTCIGQRFLKGVPPATTLEISDQLGIPSRLIQQVLQTLTSARLVVEVFRVERGYVPARPLESINAHHVLMAMRAAAGQELLTRDEPVRIEVYGEFARIEQAEKQAASTISLLELINRAQARLELAGPDASHEPAKMVPAFTPPLDKD